MSAKASSRIVSSSLVNSLQVNFSFLLFITGIVYKSVTITSTLFVRLLLVAVKLAVPTDKPVKTEPLTFTISEDVSYFVLDKFDVIE